MSKIVFSKEQIKEIKVTLKKAYFSVVDARESTPIMGWAYDTIMGDILCRRRFTPEEVQALRKTLWDFTPSRKHITEFMRGVEKIDHLLNEGRKSWF
ncbi:hypothetical protein M0R19_05710 [Candidatus Pacearchaeota archaeon]|nr:hypothetical protein [Candidatus Pacearchaeota archaeon]